MNKKYLKENNLYEAHKQFMRLCEWSYVPNTLEEADDEMPEDGGNDAPPPMDEPQGDGGEDGGMPPMDGGSDAPPMDGNDAPPPMDEPQGDGGDVPPMDGGLDAPPPSPMGDDMPPMGEPSGEEDEVIDVDDITNAQEKVNGKVNTVGKNLGKVDDKISDLMNSIESMLNKIETQNQEIANLKQEFEKRSPTPTEKLNLRSLDSYPFNVRPDEYWRDKSATSNYQSYGDNGESTTQEYTITNNDVDDFDERQMADSFYIDDDMKQDIEKIFRNF